MAAHPHRRGRLVVAGIAVGIIVLLVGAGVAWWAQRGASKPSIDRAVDRFRSATTGPASTGTMQPRPGVYIYAGSGEERLSFMATHQPQDGALPATVTRHANGCWDFAIEYNSFHRQTWRRCVVGGRLTERGNTTEQKFDFGPLSESEHAEVVCDPAIVLYDPEASPGDSNPVRCRGHSETTNANMTQRGRVTFVGRTTVTVGGEAIRALHFTQDLTISGDQRGSSHEELWIAEKDGLPLREERTTTVVSPAPAPLNEVTYSEHGQWELTSLTPRT